MLHLLILQLLYQRHHRAMIENYYCHVNFSLSRMWVQYCRFELIFVFWHQTSRVVSELVLEALQMLIQMMCLPAHK